MDWKRELEQLSKSSFTGGVIAALVMIALGIAMLCNPQASLGTIVWLMIIGFFAAGLYRVIAYGKMPYWIRQGFSLVTGVMDIVVSVLMAIAAINEPVLTEDTFALVVGFMFAFEMLFAGINTLSATGVVSRMGGGTGWLVASGVLDIVAAFLLFSAPVASTVVLMYFLAFALIVGGISIIATALDIKNRAKAFRAYIDDSDEPFDPDNDPFFTWKRH